MGNISSYGTFRVTTENCSFNDTRELGIYTGYLDEIAFALADKCNYALHFEKIDLNGWDKTPKAEEISISISDGNIDIQSRMEYLRDLLKDRNVEVYEDEYYNRVMIRSNKQETLQNTVKDNRERSQKSERVEEIKVLHKYLNAINYYMGESRTKLFLKLCENYKDELNCFLDNIR